MAQKRIVVRRSWQIKTMTHQGVATHNLKIAGVGLSKNHKNRVLDIAVFSVVESKIT